MKCQCGGKLITGFPCNTCSNCDNPREVKKLTDKIMDNELIKANNEYIEFLEKHLKKLKKILEKANNGK